MANDLLIQPLAEAYLQNKDDKSFDQLYNRISPGIKHYINELGCTYLDIETLDDLVARTFYKALTKLDQYDYTKGNFSTWLFTIARNEVFNEFRLLKRHVLISKITPDECESDISYLEGIIDKEKYEVNFRDLLEESEFYQKRREIITLICWEIEYGINNIYKTILIDREILGMSYKDLAIKYNLPINTVKSRIKIGRELVKKAVADKVEKIKKEVQEMKYG